MGNKPDNELELTHAPSEATKQQAEELREKFRTIPPEVDKPSEGRLLTDLELHKAFCAPLAIRYGSADGEALRHCIRIVKEECAKTASILRAEHRQKIAGMLEEINPYIEQVVNADKFQDGYQMIDPVATAALDYWWQEHKSRILGGK